MCQYAILSESMAKLQFNFSDIDKSVRPQDDFFLFAGGGWLRKNPIPKTESVWGRFHVLRHQTLLKTHAILKDCARKKRVRQGSDTQLIRDFYRSGMDMATRNKRDLSPLAPTLRKINAIETKDDLFSFLFSEHKKGCAYLWSGFVGQDDKDSDTYIFHLAQGTLSLPDRDYYLRQDAQAKDTREKFTGYIATLLVQAGAPASVAAKEARRIRVLETKLARISMSRTDAHDIDKVYHKLSRAALRKKVPSIPWQAYFKTLGVHRKVRALVVLQPEYLARLGRLCETVPVSTWKTYLRFLALHEAAPYLSQPYIDIWFSFNGRVLAGSRQLKPLWKRVTATLDSAIGELIGKEYVKRHFSARAKKKINELVDNLEHAYARRIKALDWMTPYTKRRALRKLKNMTRKLGYPKKWRAYRGLRIQPDTYYENVLRTEAFLYRKNLNRLGKKVNKEEWFVPPQTVNAYYAPNNNDIVFPAGILQPPFFDPDGDDALNYGCIGSIIGHEMTHGFDDQGAKFDEKSNYRAWWKKEDVRAFVKRTQVVVRQYNAYTVDNLFVNGTLTLGENIADLGGLEIAYDALQLHLRTHPNKTIGGFTPQQRFFLGLALFEAEHSTKEMRRLRVVTDPHSPNKYRVNGPFSNMDSFHEAFGVQEGDALYRPPSQRAKIW